MRFPHARTGRPTKRANLDDTSVSLSFRVPPEFKNLPLDLSEANDMSMTDLVLTLVLREAGIDSLAALRDTIEELV